MKEACCPICKRRVPTEGPEASAFPFCSARCKLVDLGAWLDGSYRIAGEPLGESAGEDVLAMLTSHDGGDA